MKKLAIFLIGVYRGLSFIFPLSCKFYPSCSQFAEQAFIQYSFFIALRKVIKRLVKCNWFSKGGVDFLN
ncbi:MAG: membrane protein insertion efficiency factor YidD [Candidatus Omnitrophica bacterium]|nr:membrane protein insertion efficiency factor YidD [Candidatus Omnitrophota bacterium]MCM8825913.1 membrane protein insertion efficiency factor YidD [Candidatus Omnitrophota bacterium]